MIDANKVVYAILLGFTCFMAYKAESKERELKKALVEYTNELARSDSLEVVAGGWEKRAIEVTKLSKLLEKDNDHLLESIDSRDQEIVSLTKSSLKWKGLYISLKNAESVTDTVIVDDMGSTRYKVNFSFIDGLNKVQGYTLTNPPEANIKFEWTRPLNLTTVLTKDSYNSWFAYIDSPDTNFVPIDIDVKIDPTVINTNSNSWYNNFWWGLGVAGSSTGMGANLGLSYQYNKNKMFGFTYNYSSTGSLKGITYQARF